MSPVSLLAPLLSDAWAPTVSRQLRLFREHGVLDAVDTHVVDHLVTLVGESDPDVALALGLATRAPRHGHICVDLASVDVADLLWEHDDNHERPPPPLELPSDRAAWTTAVAGSSLVGGRDDRSKPFVLDGTFLYPARYFAYQRRLAEALRARMTRTQPPGDAGLLRTGLQALFGAQDGRIDRQALATAMALLRSLTVISGGPGTGKTYTVRSILTLLWAQWATCGGGPDGSLGPATALAAPTGKAASRMKESLLADLDVYLRERAGNVLGPNGQVDRLRAYLVSLEPRTLHRLLGWNPATPTRFRCNADNPIPADVIVVDETSMVDLALMTKLVDATPKDARLILLGDQHQLASVEAGSVLADLCGRTSVEHVKVSRGFAEELRDRAGMPQVMQDATLMPSPGPWDAIVQLSENRRFSAHSGIGKFASACLADAFDVSAAVDSLAGGGADVEIIFHGPEGPIAPKAAAQIVDGYLPYLERLLAGPREGESTCDLHLDVLRLFDKFRVLCAHRGGRHGVAGLNRRIVELLARQEVDETDAAPAGHRCLRLPHFRPEGEFWVGRPVIVERNDYAVGLFNGDVGVVVKNDGERQVVFPHGSGVRYVVPARLPEHQTVFAMTIHKSQGSEFDHAMVVLPDKASPVLTRELIYTAVTRARRKVTLVCDEEMKVLRQALAKKVQRASGLRAELRGDARDADVDCRQYC